MPRRKLTFPGHDGNQLAGLLDLPDQSPEAFALFAHCFTCGKDIAAASRIARGLVKRGYGVLRFDFTGLGDSEGNFADTNFSTNVQDLLKAADFLRDNFHAPQLLVGHSLGGTAALFAAHQLDECRAVATIAAPSEPEHVLRHFTENIARMETQGAAQIDVGGQRFTIKQQFLDDVRNNPAKPLLKQLKTPLLVLHSPLDEVVSINEAEQIYVTTAHPKSFVSLDTADHLLSDKRDAQYAAQVIAEWAGRYIANTGLIEAAPTTVSPGEVLVDEHNLRFTRTVSTDYHSWFADEPVASGGDNLGPDPYEHLLASLGSCTSMTLRMYANRKKMPLTEISVTLKHERDYAADCEQCDEKPRQIDTLSRKINLTGELTQAQRQQLLAIADKCPVHKTLLGNIKITNELID